MDISKQMIEAIKVFESLDQSLVWIDEDGLHLSHRTTGYVQFPCDTGDIRCIIPKKALTAGRAQPFTLSQRGDLALTMTRGPVSSIVSIQPLRYAPARGVAWSETAPRLEHPANSRWREAAALVQEMADPGSPYGLDNIRFHRDGTAHRAAASNGAALRRAVVQDCHPAPAFEVPAWAALLIPEQSTLTVSTDSWVGHTVRWACKEYTLETRVKYPQFPDYSSIIDGPASPLMSFDRKQMLAAMKALGAKKNNRIIFTEGRLALHEGTVGPLIAECDFAGVTWLYGGSFIRIQIATHLLLMLCTAAELPTITLYTMAARRGAVHKEPMKHTDLRFTEVVMPIIDK